jgi:hypothetical protein
MAPDYECPNCGAVYVKMEAVLRRATDSNNRENPQKQSSNKNPSDGVCSDKGFIEQFKSAPLRQKVFIISIFLFGGIAAVYNHLIQTKNPMTYDSTYSQSENLNGVKFYYFTKNNAPLLEPTNNFTDLNDAQLKKVLSLIQGIPEMPSVRSFRKGGKYIFSAELNQSGSVSIHIRKCNEQTVPYFCIEKIIYSPDAKEMARIKAKKMPHEYAFVSEEEYGSSWPYKFQFGLLACKPYRDVVIIANNKVYAVNGKAMSAKRQTGEKMYEDAWDVRKPLFGSGRMPPPAGFINKGLALCAK